jgi:hypothetical protein
MLDVFQARSLDPRIKVWRITSPTDEMFANAASESLAQYFIYLVCCASTDAYRTQFLLVKVPVNYFSVQILELLNGAR